LTRALLRDPAVLLLDEVTAVPDRPTERRTTIAATRRLASVIDYDQIYVLETGRIIEAGRHEQLLSGGGLYAQLWAEQNPLPASDQPTVPLADALRQIPLFAGLDPPGFDLVSRSADNLWLDRDQTLPEQRDALYLVKSGRAEILAPEADGGFAPTQQLHPGQTFGLSAPVAAHAGRVLRALSPLHLLVLNAEALTRLAQALPSLRPALDSARAPVTPVGGDRLSQVRLPPPPPAER
jgi:Cyclic nucleotide-binding domain